MYDIQCAFIHIRRMLSNVLFFTRSGGMFDPRPLYNPSQYQTFMTISHTIHDLSQTLFRKLQVISCLLLLQDPLLASEVLQYGHTYCFSLNLLHYDKFNCASYVIMCLVGTLFLSSSITLEKLNTVTMCMMTLTKSCKLNYRYKPPAHGCHTYFCW